MIPYLAIYFIVLLASKKIQPKKWTKLDFLILSLLICMAGFRFMIGTDYDLYSRMFEQLSLATVNDSRTGLGYNLIALQFKNFGFNFQAFIFICALITNTFVYIFLKNNSKKPGLSLLMYLAFGFYTFSFNGFRQALSMSFFLFGYTNKKRGRFILMGISYLVSFFIHSISGLGIVVTIIIDLLPNIQIYFKKILPYIVLVYIFFDKIFLTIISNSSGYSYYQDSSEEYMAGIGTMLRVLQYLAIYFLVFYTYSRQKKTIVQEKDDNSLKLAKIGTLIMIFSLKNWLIYRLSLQFLIFNCLHIVKIDEIKIVNIKKIQNLSLHAVLFIFYILNIISFDGVFPYQSIFNTGAF